jgi:CBS domain-containing protein
MQAKDIMTVNVISVSEETPVHEIVSRLLKYRISAVPVIDSARKVVGIVSEGDLLRGEGTSRWTDFVPSLSWREQFDPLLQIRASQLSDEG